MAIIVVDITETKKIKDKLEESEAKHREMIEKSSTITWATTPDGHFIDRNESWEDFTGQKYDEYKGYGWAEAIHPDDREKLMEVWLKAVANKSFYHHEARLFNRHSKKYHHFLVNAVPFLGKDGEIESWFGANTDINKIKEYQDALKLNEERLQLAIAGTSDGLWDMPDINEVEEWWSPGFYQLLGYEEGEIEANVTTFEEKLLHPDDREATVAKFMEAIQQSTRFDVEHRLQLKSGEYRWFRIKANVAQDEAGYPIRMSGSLSDIHLEKTTQIELKEAQHFLNKVINIVPSVIYVFNQTTMSNEYMNRDFGEVVGYTPEEIQSFGENLISEICHPDDLPLVLSILKISRGYLKVKLQDWNTE